MREIERIVDQLRRAANGDAWFGPSVRSSLQGVDADAATSRSLPGAHTICEIVLHMTSWTREVTRRLHGGEPRDPEEGDWPARPVATEAQWAAIVAAFDAANEALVEAIAGLDESTLDDRIGDERNRALGSGVSRYATLHGLGQHHAYHAGQIMLLKRAAGRAPAS